MRKHPRFHLALPLAFAAMLPALLGAAYARAGVSAIPAAFVDIGFGAREMGMGGANVAGSGRAIDLVWNPAGLASLQRPELTAMQTDQFGKVPYYLLAGALPWRSGAGAALGLVSSGDALLRENTLLLAFAQQLGRERGLELGATLKLRHAGYGPPSGGEGVSGSAYGAGLDLGLRGWLGPFTLGFAARDILGTLRWRSSVMGSYYESVPPTLSGGFALRAGPLLLASDLETWPDSERPLKLALGLEWTVHPVLVLRGGMRQRIEAEEGRFLTLGAGLGYDFARGSRMQLDSAYLLQELGNSLRISLSYLF